MREMMEKEVAEKEVLHAKNEKAYRAAMEANVEAGNFLREACAIASASQNQLGAAREALRKYNEINPAVEVEGTGQMGA